MNKSLFLFLLFFGMAQAQIVNIPDPNFKNKLIAENVDTNNDGNIQVAEALAVNILDVSGEEISDFTGIEAFTNLEDLRCGFNNATSINVATLTNLIILELFENQITSLDISTLSNLNTLIVGENPLATLITAPTDSMSHLDCMYTDLSYINLEHFPNLSIFNCQGTQLTQIDADGMANLHSLNTYDMPLLSTISVIGCTSLSDLSIAYGSPLLHSINASGCAGLLTADIGSAALESLDLSGCSSLTSFYIEQAPLLSSLNLSGCTSLHTLQVLGGSIETLDLSLAPSLTSVYVGIPTLISLNLKNGTVASMINIGSQNLQFICADEIEVSAIQSQIEPGIAVSSYCSFTPGGNYNTITGNLTFDVNGDGCGSGTDAFPAYIRMDLSGDQTDAVYASSSGNYSFYTSAGDFTVTPSTESPWFTFSPLTASVSYPEANFTIETRNFCIVPNGVHNDVEVILAPSGPARPGFDAAYILTYKNKGNTTLNGIVSLNFDDPILDFVSAETAPDSNTAGMLQWNYADLMPFEARSFIVTFNVNSPMETPSVNQGDVLNYSVVINPVSGDEFPEDNTFNLNQTVVNAYDPNAITCLEGDTVSTTQIGNYLHYIVEFENVGNADAINIVLKNAIDPDKFDAASLQILSSSHEMSAQMKGNVIEFVFEDINLEAAAHGHVIYKIKSLPTLSTGATVLNSAEIFFDYNFPVATNVASTTFTTLSNPNFQSSRFSLVPNPASDSFTVESTSEVLLMEIYDIQGRVVKNISGKSADVSDLTPGIYMVKIFTAAGWANQKLIRK